MQAWIRRLGVPGRVLNPLWREQGFKRFTMDSQLTPNAVSQMLEMFHNNTQSESAFAPTMQVLGTRALALPHVPQVGYEQYL